MTLKNDLKHSKVLSVPKIKFMGFLGTVRGKIPTKGLMVY